MERRFFLAVEQDDNLDAFRRLNGADFSPSIGSYARASNYAHSLTTFLIHDGEVTIGTTEMRTHDPPAIVAIGYILNNIKIIDDLLIDLIAAVMSIPMRCFSLLDTTSANVTSVAEVRAFLEAHKGEALAYFYRG